MAADPDTLEDEVRRAINRALFMTPTAHLISRDILMANLHNEVLPIIKTWAAAQDHRDRPNEGENLIDQKAVSLNPAAKRPEPQGMEP